MSSRVAALALVLSLIAAACSVDDVVVAREPVASGGSGGSAGAGGGPPGCASNDDCPANTFCEKASCGDKDGTCAPRPITCDDIRMESCGCDQITYWNDCLRRQSGIASAAQGPCTGGLPCHDNPELECGTPDASCARLVFPGQQCDPPPPGMCWVLPSTCPSSPPPERWGLCGMMGQPGPGPGPMPTCSPTCEAIRAGKPVHLLSKKLPDCP